MEPEVIVRIVTNAKHAFLLLKESGECAGYCRIEEAALMQARANDYRMIYMDDGQIMEYRPGEKPKIFAPEIPENE